MDGFPAAPKLAFFCFFFGIIYVASIIMKSLLTLGAKVGEVGCKEWMGSGKRA